MKKASSVLLPAVALMLIVSHSKAADDADAPLCPNDGYISHRLVPTARVAKEIYRAVAHSLSSGVLKRYPVIIAKDEGDHWGMSQTDNVPPPKSPPNTVIVSVGGGQLNLDIDKCTGAISHAAFNR